MRQPVVAGEQAAAGLIAAGVNRFARHRQERRALERRTLLEPDGRPPQQGQPMTRLSTG
jgi:hypothetical protein